MDVRGMLIYKNNPTSPNAVHPAKAGLNTAMGYLGLKGGGYGAMISTIYFGMDAFYPGGWDGAMNDTARRQAEFGDIVNTNPNMGIQYVYPYGSQKF